MNHSLTPHTISRYFTAAPVSSPGDRHLYRVSDSGEEKARPECLTCSSSLCQLCLAAHRRVHLTKDHDIKISNTPSSASPATPGMTLLGCFKSMVDLVNMTWRHKCLHLEEAIDSCISEALDFKSDHPDLKFKAEDDKILQELLSPQLQWLEWLRWLLLRL